MFNHQDTKAPRSFEPIPANQDNIGRGIVDAAFQVHSTLGPGLLENVYEECFICELKDKGLNFERQKLIPFKYRNHTPELSYRLDLLVENSIIVELKCVERLLPLHDAQILTYMKLMNLRLGYLINFNVPIIKEGIKRKAL